MILVPYLLDEVESGADCGEPKIGTSLLESETGVAELDPNTADGGITPTVEE